MTHRRILYVILLAYLTLATLYSIITPIFEVSDELWHYPMVKYLADHGLQLPSQDPANPGPWRQEGSQPPLYYMISALLTTGIDTSDMDMVRRINPHADIGVVRPDGNANMIVHRTEMEAFPWRGTTLAVHVARFFSIALGLCTVLVTYQLAREIFSDEPYIALGAAALNAFLPMFLFISASVNNDNLSNLLGNLLTLLIVRLVKVTQLPRWRNYALLGIVAGAGLLSKLNIGFLIPLVILALIVVSWRLRNWQPVVFGGAIAGALTITLARWWYWRNWQLYGDPTGLNMFLNMVGRRSIPANAAQLWSERHSFMQSYWGFFGGMNVPMPEVVYLIFNIIGGVVLLGALAFIVYTLVGKKRPLTWWLSAAITIIWPLVTFVSFLRWTAETPASQGRLIFGALSSISLWMAVGLVWWLPGRLQKLPISIVSGFFATISLFILPLIIAPNYLLPAQIDTTTGIGFFKEDRGVFYLMDSRINTPIVNPEDYVFIETSWASSATTDQDWSMFVHLVTKEGVIISQRDIYPGQGKLATSDLNNRTWNNTLVVWIPPAAYAPATLDVLVGWYLLPTGERLQTAVHEDAWKIGEVQLESRLSDLNVPNPININFDNQVELVGYSLSDLSPDAGDSVELTLYWRGMRDIERDYVVFVHIIDPTTQTIHAGSDAMPVQWQAPTSTWEVGNIVEDTHTLTVNPDAPPGIYELEIGLYLQEPDGSFPRLRIVTPDGGMANNFAYLTRVRVMTSGEELMRLRRLASPDIIAIALLVVLWLLFFWRLFTPIEADQASVVKGDFSGQFVVFAGYQYQRFTHGEVPLWNPYNNGGFPFIGDTQAAVFYPPRLLTIALSYHAGGWSYHALELEMTFHILTYSLFMYALIRRMTLGSAGSVYGAFVAAVVASYSGFMSGYAPLQLAILEAGIWLPLALLGILEATRNESLRWLWLTFTGFTFGLSWMAGHPQTSWFITYLLVAFFAYRSYIQHYSRRTFVVGTVLFGAIAGGIAAVQLLPGVEYLAHTTRAGLGFDEKGNGFPFQDIAQFIFPGVVSLFSPLYVGLVGLVLAVIALWRRLPGSLFWGIVALAALGLSFGANSAIYATLYNILPGLRFFRGQERAAYLVASSLAILAGLGAAHLVSWDWLQDFKATRRIRQGLLGLFAVCAIITGIVFSQWLGNREDFGAAISPMAFSLVITALTFFVIPLLLANPQHRPRQWLFAALIVFELFTVNMNAERNYQSVPPDKQLSITPPPLVAQVLADTDLPYRVDGFRGLHDNYGSLYGVMDMRGISPLFLDGPYTLIQPNNINPRAWELFAVRYVFTDWQELSVPSEIIATGEDRYGPVNLHRLIDSRPFAHLVHNVAVVESDTAAFTLLAEPIFNTRQTVILNQPLSVSSDGEGTAVVTKITPEQFTIEVNTSGEAILSIAHPHYPGWRATLDGTPTDILRAYGALSAVEIPPGQHVVEFVYDPLTYRLGAVISLLMWGASGILGLIFLAKAIRHVRNEPAPGMGRAT